MAGVCSEGAQNAMGQPDNVAGTNYLAERISISPPEVEDKAEEPRPEIAPRLPAPKEVDSQEPLPETGKTENFPDGIDQSRSPVSVADASPTVEAGAKGMRYSDNTPFPIKPRARPVASIPILPEVTSYERPSKSNSSI